MAPKTDVIEQLRAHIAELEEENARLRTVPMKYRRMAFNAQLQDENNQLRSQLASAEQRVAEAFIEYMVDLKQQDFAFTGTTVIGIEKCETAIRSGEYRKFMKEV